MAVGDIQLGPVGSETLMPAFGRTFSEALEEIGREERTASARLVKDVVAQKKIFTLAYSAIDGDELEIIKALFALKSELNFIHQVQASQQETFTVIMRPFAYDRLVLLAPGLWENASIELAEV